MNPEMGDGEMPKEVVLDDVTKGFRVETTWGRHEQCIQIATVASDALPRLVDMLNELLAACGMPTVDGTELKSRAKKPLEAKFVTGARNTTVQAHFFTGWHVTITDRQQVNELIRHLRRARDHAFGRDE